MSQHKIRRQVATGSEIEKKGTRSFNMPRMVRIMGSFPAEDWKCIVWLAKKRGVPVANVLRDAVFSYVMPIRPDVT